MQNSTSVVLFSKRRYGKSSLIKEIFKNHIDSKKYLCIYVDIFDISSSEDFSYSFYKAIAKSFKTDINSILQTLKQLFSKATFSATVSQNGEIEFKPSLTNQSFEDMIEDIFHNLTVYLKKHDLKAIIAIDEFQQVATIKDKNIEAILRKHIQNINNISFIYSGSKRHMLTQMFTDHKKPFYAQAVPMELKPIPQKDFYEFIKDKFASKTISFETFELLYKKTNAESWLIQNISYHLWQKESQITKELVENTIQEVVRMSDAIFRTLYDSFSITQKTALKTTVKNSGTNLLSKDVLNKTNISKSSLSSALKTLLEKEIIDKKEDIYYINDRLFEMWLDR